MALKSTEMQMTSSERRWLPWFGSNGKFRLRWSCWVNSDLYPIVEQTFEGIAQTRRNHLTHWAEGHWGFLDALARQIGSASEGETAGLLADWLKQAPDYSELFVVDRGGRVIYSTYPANCGSNVAQQPLAEGLKAPFLHGPYADPDTQRIGPSCSRFHDAVTLMFYQPLKRGGEVIGCLCGRIPNDVMSDIIQREAGHVYPDSGDNYIFMVESRFDRNIQPGTALSRSRFEDAAFTGGDNLKNGVRTDFGTVKIKNHTELELRFTDPATNQLHPGVRETMARGSNLFVTYPGYPDYRHIPVIGKGVTFQMPGSPDRWGMMCEADLEEAYRRRSMPYRFWKTSIKALMVAALGFAGCWYYLQPANEILLAIGATMAFMVGLFVHYRVLAPVSQRTNAVSAFLLDIAECGGTLDKRLASDMLTTDETGQMGRWVNSFVDKIDETVSSVLQVAKQVTMSASALSSASVKVAESSTSQTNAAADTANAVNGMGDSIAAVASHAGETEHISSNASQLSKEGKGIVQDAAAEMEKTSASIADLSVLVSTLNQRSDEISQITGVIREIAEQTNLLALNAAIEAARAGEQGRGFAVVADEVRKLAERTAQSTTQITGMIENIQNETRNAVNTMEICRDQAQSGVMLANRAGQSLEQINNGADETRRMVSEIVLATQQQITTGKDISRNMERIAGMADQNNAQVTHVSRSVRMLEQLANELQKAVSKFAV